MKKSLNISLSESTDHRAVSSNVDDEWKELKVADEVSGKRKKQRRREGLNIWNDNITKGIKEK